MKTPTKLLLLAAIAAVIASTGIAQESTGKKKGPVGKLYVAEVVGDGQVVADGRVYVPKQGSAYDAPGAVIETGKNSRQAIVCSNGSAMFLDQNTRLEIGRFAQEPFRAGRNSSDVEPSISQTEIFLAQGLVGVCSGGLLSGTTMTYSTALASVNVRGRKVVIEAAADHTVVSALEGDVTIRISNRDPSGQVVHAGERAVITPGASGQPPVVRITAMDPATLATADGQATQACGARKTVSFETVDSPPDGVDIEVHATVSAHPDTNITVSPDRIEPGK
jgi:hypothetical protein